MNNFSAGSDSGHCSVNELIIVAIGKKAVATMFVCKFCSICIAELKQFCSHVKEHQHTANYRFGCGIQRCPASYQTFSAFRSHMHRNHRYGRPQTKLIHIQGNLACKVQACSYVAENFSSLCAHLRFHIKDGKKVTCPYDGCHKYFRVRSSFATHISRKHNKAAAAQVVDQHSNTGCSTQPLDENLTSTSCDNVEDKCDEESFLHNLALFFLKMQGKMLLPASTIQSIIEGFQHVHSSSMSDFYGKLKSKLSELNMSQTEIGRIIDELSKEDLFSLYREGILRSDKTRKTFYKQHFDYVEPTQIYLGTDGAGKERFCQYISIKDTLKSLFRHSSVKEQYQLSKNRTSTNMVVEDVADGKNVKDNQLLNGNPSSLSLILYQDAFEVVNPLGSGKKKHKILGVYMSLGEFQPHNRSCVDPMQLVMLCRENDLTTFGQEKVFLLLFQSNLPKTADKKS